MAAIERDYILGTHDEELARLGLQHRVWRRRALDAWIDAGFTTGQTIIDVGCGPGYASLDLAQIASRVIAIDQSRRFLDALRRQDVPNIETFEADLDRDPLPRVDADGAWARWVFAFVKDPQALLHKVRAMLRRGGALVIHEYFDYASWRMAPRSDVFEEFVAAVIKSWRASGGEPDIGLDLCRWLPSAGFSIRRARPIVDVISPASFIWQWPASFIASGAERLVDLHELSRDRAEELKRLIAEPPPDTIMSTPAVLEIIATAE